MYQQHWKKDSEELIAALKGGDEAAFTFIYKEYWYPLFLLAYRKLQNREIAEELVQDIFTKLWRDRETTRIVKVDAYLFSAMRYEIIDHIRAHVVREGYKKYQLSFSAYESVCTENTVLLQDLQKNLDSSIGQLPEKTREVFQLSRMDHWPVARIAKHLGVSEKAVEYHLTKATKFMRGSLKEHLISLLALIGFFFL